MSKLDVLRRVSFGERVAEQETDALASYFVETDNWMRVLDGSKDIVYGAKGAGKSALYALLVSRTDQLFDRGIVLVPAENPRGAVAFRSVAGDLGATEQQFAGVWKLYFASLLHSVLADFGAKGASFDALEDALAKEGLTKKSLTLGDLVQTVMRYVRHFTKPSSVEGGLKLDPATQMPIGVTGKITFENSIADDAADRVPVDKLLALADDALRMSKLKAWICLDRLDVAFAESDEVEARALRALFRVYLDMAAADNISLKIFLRSDVWSRITQGGFREASHIVRHVTISWDRPSLVNLMVRRVLHNGGLRELYGVDERVASSPLDAQEAFMHRILPDQVDVGRNKPTSVGWLLSRTQDATQLTAPRELIHLLNSLRDVQVRKLELGEDEPDGERLFARQSIKDALPEVSKIRLEQTLYAEHPDLKDRIEELRGQKATQSAESLAQLWAVEIHAANGIAERLAEIGFFEVRKTGEQTLFWVPFLYRDALNLVMGAAD